MAVNEKFSHILALARHIASFCSAVNTEYYVRLKRMALERPSVLFAHHTKFLSVRHPWYMALFVSCSGCMGTPCIFASRHSATLWIVSIWIMQVAHLRIYIWSGF